MRHCRGREGGGEGREGGRGGGEGGREGVGRERVGREGGRREGEDSARGPMQYRAATFFSARFISMTMFP